MKTKLFTLLLAVAASVGTMFASTKIGNLYYNLNAANQTAEVTLSSDKYSGDIIIPSSVTYNSVYSVTRIGVEAFDDCTGLTSVTIPNSVTSIGMSAFYGCTGLTSVTIPNSVIVIGWYAFRGCTGLTSVTIPNSVTSIEDGAFFECSGLTSLSVEAGNTVYDSRNNCNAIINTSTNTLIFGCQNTTIPNSVTSIGYGAFENCSSLTSVTIPNSVTSIGNYAFEYCSNLTSVTIGNSVTSIGMEAFYMCTGLTSVTCFATTPPQLDYGVFSGVDKSIPLYVPAGSVSAYKSADQWKDFMNILPISHQDIEDVQGNNVQCTKIVHNGQILILRGDKVYTLQGQEVK